MTNVTRILNAIERGDAKATDELLPLVYDELRAIAARKISRETPGQALSEGLPIRIEPGKSLRLKVTCKQNTEQAMVHLNLEERYSASDGHNNRKK